jgi:hypothetical protein
VAGFANAGGKDFAGGIAQCEHGAFKVFRNTDGSDSSGFRRQNLRRSLLDIRGRQGNLLRLAGNSLYA